MLLLGNNVFSASILIEAKNQLLILEDEVGPDNISLPMYNAGLVIHLDTIIHVVTAQPTQLGTLLPSSDAVSDSYDSAARPSDSFVRRRAKAPRMLVVKLHTFTHSTGKDMKEVLN